MDGRTHKSENRSTQDETRNVPPFTSSYRFHKHAIQIDRKIPNTAQITRSSPPLRNPRAVLSLSRLLRHSPHETHLRTPLHTAPLPSLCPRPANATSAPPPQNPHTPSYRTLPFQRLSGRPLPPMPAAWSDQIRAPTGDRLEQNHRLVSTTYLSSHSLDGELKSGSRSPILDQPRPQGAHDGEEAEEGTELGGRLLELLLAVGRLRVPGVPARIKHNKERAL